MLNSQSAIAAVRRSSSPGHVARVGPRPGRDIHSQGSMPTTVISEAGPAAGPAEAIWRSVFWFFLEGFALYGASVHWVASTAVATIASEVEAQERQRPARRERRNSISLVSAAAHTGATVPGREDAIDQPASGTRMPSMRDGILSSAREVDRYRLVHPGWLALIWRATASRWARWRRERQIGKAVAALAEYDDRTLRDMGIPHRSQIEQLVRDGRDC